MIDLDLALIEQRLRRLETNVPTLLERIEALTLEVRRLQGAGFVAGVPAVDVSPSDSTGDVHHRAPGTAAYGPGYPGGTT